MIFFLHLFLIGLASSFHCITMCGPISLALPLDRSSNRKMLQGVLVANFGRILTYSVLGTLIGLLGFSLGFVRGLQIGSIALGVLFIILAWRRSWINKLEIRQKHLNGWTIKSMGKLLKKRGNFRLLGIGLLNGLLPCGMVLLGLASSLLASTPWESGLGMAFFGLGTLPGLLSVAFLAQKLSGTFRNQISKAYPVLITCIGILMILRGANLGIPYLSPKIEQTKTSTRVENHQPVTVQVICHENPVAEEN